MGSTNDSTKIVQTSGTYDEHSIMHYASDENCKGKKYHLKDFPLVKWKKTGDYAPPPGTIPTDENAVYIYWPKVMWRVSSRCTEVEMSKLGGHVQRCIRGKPDT